MSRATAPYVATNSHGLSQGADQSLHRRPFRPANRQVRTDSYRDGSQPHLHRETAAARGLGSGDVSRRLKSGFLFFIAAPQRRKAIPFPSLLERFRSGFLLFCPVWRLGELGITPARRAARRASASTCGRAARL